MQLRKKNQKKKTHFFLMHKAHPLAKHLTQKNFLKTNQYLNFNQRFKKNYFFKKV